MSVMDGIPRRATLNGWYDIMDYFLPGDSIAMTTDEWEALQIEAYGRTGIAPAWMMGRPVIRIPRWADWDKRRPPTRYEIALAAVRKLYAR